MITLVQEVVNLMEEIVLPKGEVGSVMCNVHIDPSAFMSAPSDEGGTQGPASPGGRRNGGQERIDTARRDKCTARRDKCRLYWLFLEIELFTLLRTLLLLTHPDVHHHFHGRSAGGPNSYKCGQVPQVSSHDFSDLFSIPALIYDCAETYVSLVQNLTRVCMGRNSTLLCSFHLPGRKQLAAPAFSSRRCAGSWKRGCVALAQSG